MRGGGIERERNSEILRERERETGSLRERERQATPAQRKLKRGACIIQYPPLYWQH